MTLTERIKAARVVVNAQIEGTPEFNAACAIVRSLVSKQTAAAPAEEFCSLDSGIHRTRMMDGRCV